MSEKRKVILEVTLTDGAAEQAEALQESDPEFLSRIVEYGLTRKSIYDHLKSIEDQEVEPVARETGGGRAPITIGDEHA